MRRDPSDVGSRSQLTAWVSASLLVAFPVQSTDVAHAWSVRKVASPYRGMTWLDYVNCILVATLANNPYSRGNAYLPRPTYDGLHAINSAAVGP